MARAVVPRGVNIALLSAEFLMLWAAACSPALLGERTIKKSVR
jgi:hypothetical protein